MEDLPESDRRVLRNYGLPDGRLKDIPRQLKKKLIVLRYLATQFEPGKRYPEYEVNAILSRYHDDYASLRRDLVDLGFMARAGGEYWRRE